MRHFLSLATVALLTACNGPAPRETKIVVDSTPVTPPTTFTRDGIKDFVFYDDTFFLKPLAIDLTDSVAIKKAFSDNWNRTTAFYNENNSVWYSHHEMTGTVAMEYNYFPSEERPIYVDYINTNDERLPFANGVRVGMSKNDFISRFKLDTAAIKKSSRLVINCDSAMHEAVFEFEAERLARISVAYEYDENSPAPRNLNDLADSWTRIIITEGDKRSEMFVACDFLQFQLGTDGGPRMSRINTLGMRWENESRTDSITNIIRTEGGLTIYTLDASASWAPGVLTVKFLDDKWTTAEWNDSPFAISVVADKLEEEPCN